MPRRRALTEAQLESLLALPVTEADLVRHWTLGDDDLAVVDRRRRDSQPARLCPAALCVPLSRPAAATRRGHSAAGAAFRRRPTRRRRRRHSPPTPRGSRPGYEQLDGLRTAVRLRRPARAHGREILAWLLPVALATTNALTVATALMDELRRRRIVAPGPSIVERLVAAALVVGRAACRRISSPAA